MAMAKTDGKPKVALSEFPEYDPGAYINSPRSIQACKQEGVLPIDLIYKPLETFSEKGLSPRLVKLRYDFFEAKRRDLLSSTRRSREALVAEEKRADGNQSNVLQTISKQSGLSMGALMALNSDGIKLERQKLLRAQDQERKWLKSTLCNELAQLQKLENASAKMAEEEAGNEQKLKEAAERMKQLNDQRREEEERKALEMQAQQRLEKQIAKEEFMKQQEEMQREQEKEMAKRQEAHERSLAEMERKKQAEVEKEEKKERAFQVQQSKLEEMRAQDLKRIEILDRQRNNMQIMMREKKEAKDFRIYQSMENNMELERQRRKEYEDRLMREQQREEKMATQRALQQEEGAKKSFQLMMRRKCIQDEASRKLEERRLAIIEQQEETERRLLEHEQKKDRYLDFKRELDSLKEKNKMINVERQRRREEHKREEIAEAVAKKDEKMQMLSNERERLWAIRAATQVEAARARESVKNQIMRQRIASKYDSKRVGGELDHIMKHPLFSPAVIQGTTSMPNLAQTPAQVAVEN
jgi:hypothetical protein